MRRTTSNGDLSTRGRTFRREWYSIVLALGVAVLVPLFAISVLALPPTAVERITGPVLGSTLVDARLQELEPAPPSVLPAQAVALGQNEAASQARARVRARPGRTGAGS